MSNSIDNNDYNSNSISFSKEIENSNLFERNKNKSDIKNQLNEKGNYEVDYKNSHILCKINRNLHQIMQPKINPGTLSFETLLQIVKTHPIDRSIENTALLKNYLYNSPLQNKFSEDNLPSSLYEKLTAMLSVFAEYKFINESCSLYKGGDTPTNIYLILQGSGTISSLEKKTKQMTGFEYFNMLSDLMDAKCELILKKTIKDNYQVLPINILDLNRINVIVLKLLYQNNIKSSIRELVAKARINPSDINMDFDKNDADFMDNRIHQIQSKITKSDCRKYAFLLDKNDKYPVNIFEFNSVKNLKSGDFIGSIENDMYAHSINLNSGTHLCSIKYNIYIESIQVEKDKLLNREINFLLKHFFFKSISRKKFINHYYPFFTHQKFKKKEIVFNENSPVEYIYFIQEGEGELSSNMSILQMHALIDLMKTKLEKKDFIDFIQTKSHPKTIISQLKEKRWIKLYILSEKEVIGHESFYFQMNHLFSCRVNSEVFFLYKISVKNLLNIFKEEYDAFEDFKTESIRRVEILTNRLTFVNNITTGIVDYKNYSVEPKVEKEPLKIKRFKGKIIEKKDIDLYFNKKTLIKSPSMPNHITERQMSPLVKNSIHRKIKIALPTLKKRIRKEFEERIIETIKRDIKESKLVFVNADIEEAQVKRKEYKKLLDDSRKNNSHCSSLSFMTQLNRQISVKRLQSEVIVQKSKPISYRSPYTINKLEKYAVFDTSRIIPTDEKTMPTINEGNTVSNNKNQSETSNSISHFVDGIGPFHNKKYFDRPYHNKQRANIIYKEWIKNYLNDHYFD